MQKCLFKKKKQIACLIVRVKKRVENDPEKYKLDKFKYNLNYNLLHIWNKSKIN